MGVPANKFIWEENIRPVIGIDVAKGKSVAQAFVNRNTPFGRDQEILLVFIFAAKGLCYIELLLNNPISPNNFI